MKGRPLQSFNLSFPPGRPGSHRHRGRPRYFFASIPSGTQGPEPFFRFWALSLPLPASTTTAPSGAVPIAVRTAASRSAKTV